MDTHKTVVEQFVHYFGQPPRFVVRAPGRVNLIGDHTDYNEGFVMPMAIDRAVYIALRPRPDDTIVIHSLDFDDIVQFSINTLEKGPASPAEYVKGVVFALLERRLPLRGWEGVMKGDVPIGAGLSSSAALELAIARALVAVIDAPWDAKAMALSGQRAENEWVGIKCGIMDQMISAAGVAHHAVMIDCRDLSTTALPLPAESIVVVLDSNTRRGLVDSAYNERRAQCEEVAAFFGVPFLRDVTYAQFQQKAAHLSELSRRRARHVITENERVLAARDALLAGDAPRFGRLMVESHASMRDDFEISTPALNLLVETALAHPACFGARLTGGGFGGAGVALVRRAEVDAFLAHIDHAYDAHASSGLPRPTAYVCHATDGAALISSN
jgi:galactokinase